MANYQLTIPTTSDTISRFNLLKRSGTRPRPLTLSQALAFDYEYLELTPDIYMPKRYELYLLSLMAWLGSPTRDQSQLQLLSPFIRQLWEEKVDGFQWFSDYVWNCEKTSNLFIEPLTLVRREDRPKLFDDKLKLKYSLNNLSKQWDIVGFNLNKLEEISTLNLRCKFNFSNNMELSIAQRLGLTCDCTEYRRLDLTRGILVLDLDFNSPEIQRIDKLNLWSRVITY